MRHEYSEESSLRRKTGDGEGGVRDWEDGKYEGWW
jgi:hypothetical protein